MSKLHSKTLLEPESSNSSSYFFRLLIIVICVCLALALFLFDQDDINYFAGGITSGIYPRNPMGKWGAYTAWYMMLTFGLAAPVTVALVFFCALRRLLFNKYLDAVGFCYVAAIVLFTVALSILLATLPEQFASIASKYNLATMPGGVVGQRLGNPDSGWFHITLNTTGTTIFSSLRFTISGDMTGRNFSSMSSERSNPVKANHCSKTTSP